MDNKVHVVPLETDLRALAHEFMCRDKLFRGIVEIDDRCMCVCVCACACACQLLSSDHHNGLSGPSIYSCVCAWLVYNC